MEEEIYVISPCRTAIGCLGGSLSKVSPVKLGEIVLQEALKRGNVPHIDELLLGAVLTAGQGQNIARQMVISAKLPEKTPAYTLNMVCGSGMKTIIDGARSILSGDNQIVMVGGVENMSAAPHLLPSHRSGKQLGHSKVVDSLLRDGLSDAFTEVHMGETAEILCDKYQLSREELDQYALHSQEKAEKAQKEGRFHEEIVPIPTGKGGFFQEDEHPRHNCSLEGLAKLPPVFRPDGGKVTAGNSSGINDGAAMMILASKKAVEQYDLQPVAKLIAWGQEGIAPQLMGLGPVPATKKALEKAKLSLDQIDLIESGEAFAAQAIAVARELKLDMEKVNVNGGAIALGHPIGASGTRIAVTLLHEMKRRQAKRGLATLCIGGGMGVATIFELV